MHHKYAKEGLAVISVALDDIHDKDEPDAQKNVVNFLRQKKAVFTNLLLDEPLEFWSEKLRFTLAPCQYVFSRQGKWTQFKDVKEDVVEKLVVELLREK